MFFSIKLSKQFALFPPKETWKSGSYVYLVLGPNNRKTLVFFKKVCILEIGFSDKSKENKLKIPKFPCVNLLVESRWGSNATNFRWHK